MRAPQKMRLQPIHLAFHPFRSLSKATREWRGRAHPSDRLAAPLTHFPHPCFYFPLQSLLFHSASSLVLFCLISPSVATPASLFPHHLYFAPSCSEAILPLLSGAFFIPFFSLSLSDFLSHTFILIFTNSDGISRQYDQIPVG